MEGKLIKQSGIWMIQTAVKTIQVHKSCIPELNESMNGETFPFVVLNDFTSNNQGTEYALPILHSTNP